MKFKISTTATVYTDFIVEAENEEQAQDKFWDGQYESEEIDDIKDEEIIDVQEVA